MSTQVFALVWAKTFFESMPLPPIGNDSPRPQPMKLLLAAGEKSLFTNQSEAEKHCGYMNADYPHLNDHPVEVVPLELQ
ncbi:hypothetical protein HYT04_01900 [Candidatus Kaiserbacteria bacterium]|nr:hypothetical protein [Candidatus Kaiserbacteria bacterium]